MTRVVVIGGGIVGLATARALQKTASGTSLTVLEKEDGWARHQTGRNSGVIHSGIYYPPGTAKAAMCRAGAASMAAFVDRNDIPHVNCGKLIVAADADEIPALERLHERGAANGVAVTRLRPDEANEYEPHVRCVAALHVPATSITDFGAVCRSLADALAEQGADLRTGTRVLDIASGGGAWQLSTTTGEISADVVVNCAGLQSDRIARMAGAPVSPRIVPFRGEYYELVPERHELVRGLIYPVPDVQFPFLGVHLTKMVDGGVHAGPNAVLALSREGYRWRTVRPRDVASVLAFPGFWRLARKHARMGAAEVARSLSKRRFAASLQRLVPEIQVSDLVPAPAGVRAQALHRDGTLVDDFLIVRHERSVHVLNAPSPAATSALEIGRCVAQQVSLVM
jgi:(S)-2-hydroxyglutarate dehydrogenase